MLFLLAVTIAGCQPEVVPESPNSEEGAPIAKVPDSDDIDHESEQVQPDLDHPESLLMMTGDLSFQWSGLELAGELAEQLQNLIFRARFITGLSSFGDMATGFDFDDKIVLNGQELYRANLRYFEDYDGFVEFIRKTYTGILMEEFLNDERYVQVDGKFYADDFGFGDLTLDTGSYTANVLEADDHRILIEFTIERLFLEEPVYYNASEMEFHLCEDGWRIVRQGFEP